MRTLLVPNAAPSAIAWNAASVPELAAAGERAGIASSLNLLRVSARE
jgi:hypothetical protein